MAASIVPPNFKSKKYFSVASSGTVAGADLVLDAADFVDDTGTAITAFPSFAFYSLYINGMIQQNGVATLTSSTLTILGGAVLDGGDPITVQLGINF
ncbi:DUF4183 domain-containing protein [Tumebacillus lipolyticus]|uniref:DUF4183 domain-containing protein n=1 Tax=Tumebacillus lipolyticus TaxID=1280370 RepID=A0ABW4ZRV5_9BACL